MTALIFLLQIHLSIEHCVNVAHVCCACHDTNKNLSSFKVGLLVSLLQRREWEEERRGGMWVTKVLLRASLGLFVPQWLDWHREVHASESVCVLMDIGKWFQGGFLVLFPFNGFLCGSYPFTLASTTWAEKKREDSRAETPFGRSPPGPWQVALCSLGRKKSTGWGGSDHGSQGEEEGYWLGLDRHRDYVRPGCEFFRGE